jgi:hypothetical protein
LLHTILDGRVKETNSTARAMVVCDSFNVPVRVADQDDTASLQLASSEDMPPNWTCSWPDLWQTTDLDYQKIVKLTQDKQVWGLMRYGLYTEMAVCVEILNLETNPQNRNTNPRLVVPVGKWLIWYAIQQGLQHCPLDPDESQPFLILTSLQEAFDYYSEIINMNYEGAVFSAPGEEGYVFRFP